MSASDDYILDKIRTWVWSGFYASSDVQEMIGDILEEDTNKGLVRGAVREEFKKKTAAERSWPVTTSCDRLDDAFVDLDGRGVIALQNAGYTMSDGEEDVREKLHKRGRTNVCGYCFYHGQDLERAVAGGELWIAFGDLDGDAAKKMEVGGLVKEILEKHSFIVHWNGDPEKRLCISELDWKRRLGR